MDLILLNDFQMIELHDQKSKEKILLQDQPEKKKELQEVNEILWELEHTTGFEDAYRNTYHLGREKTKLNFITV